ncbi:hypothetical protein P9265_22270 [Schinkia azotoformans]|uniref:hypothetical protein n=1 Tax=Schinkia azotoformans TaxID=1454 RepID=UPI002E21D149|nr:hypothetical protein [Schinkia azotoformans]
MKKEVLSAKVIPTKSYNNEWYQYTHPVTKELTQAEREILHKYLSDLSKKSSNNKEKQQKTNIVYKPDGHKISVTEFASMIDQIKTIHYSRNILNAPPKTEKEAIQMGWKKMKKSESVYHQIGKGNENNAKYVSPNGQLEAVYNGEGQLVIDPKNIGTYNFVSPDDKVGHIKLDVIPYYICGNSEEDTSTNKEKAEATLESLFRMNVEKIFGQ